MVDQVSKFSYLDAFLIQSNLNNLTPQVLYNAFTNDMLLHLNTTFLPLSPIFQSDYQDSFSLLLLLSPELTLALNNYYSLYYMAPTLNTTPAPVFDAYLNNLNFYFSEGIIHFFLFFLYILFIVYFFTTIVSLR